MSSHFIISQPRCHHTGSLTESCVYDVKWSINPYMRAGSVDRGCAQLQHSKLLSVARAHGACVSEIPFVHSCFDSVFVKDMAVILKKHNHLTAFLANSKHPERQREMEARVLHLARLGVQKFIQCKTFFEGGDAAVLPSQVVPPSQPVAFVGYGFRTEFKATTEFAKAMNIKVIPLQLVDPYFYHLDTALYINPERVAFAYKDAFSKNSWKTLTQSKELTQIVSVPRADALNFALNCIEIDNTVIAGGHSAVMQETLERMGKSYRIANTSEFIRGGGSVSCLLAPIYEYH